MVSYKYLILCLLLLFVAILKKLMDSNVKGILNRYVHIVAKYYKFNLNEIEYCVEECNNIFKEGFFSNILLVVIKKKDGSLSGVPNVIVKRPPKTMLRDQFPIQDYFEKETFVYVNVLPKFINMPLKLSETTRKMVKFYDIFTRFVGAQYRPSGNEVLATISLETPDLKMWERIEPLDHDHMEAVLRTYAQLHSYSFGAKYNSELFSEIHEFAKDIPKEAPNTQEIYLSYCNSFAYLAQCFGDDSNLMTFMDTLDMKILKLLSLDNLPTKNFVLIHGDCWVGNMMFKYEDGKPIHAILLDFQLAKIENPVRDIIEFFYSHASQEQLANYKMYMKMYYDYLKIYCEAFGVTLAEVGFGYEQYEKAWTNRGVFGFVKAAKIIKAILRSQDEHKFIKDALENGDDYSKLINDEIGNEPIYETRMRALIEHFKSVQTQQSH